MADPVTWQDVFLALSGAPVGALIAVGGVHMTNRFNDKTQRALLDSQAEEQGVQREHELRVSLQQQTLAVRSQLYEQMLKECDQAKRRAAWAGQSRGSKDVPPITNEDLVPFQDRVQELRYRALVHCSSPVRWAVEQFADATISVDETSTSEQWDDVLLQAENLQRAVIDAAVADRKSVVAEDGLGGM
ncbi:hypothetical protein CFH99_16670 [Nocardioides aromaticivorans]|uniref:Uncharacterized protein n=1 Tax=Nocardioides aromaticivorans TaxID=200618 RepID=A0ABX7PN11_9ACTN|nr:hypothetical protein [Nocardioides aromaticivorans]QSR27256.1 hypothetical protein CFH99_16670 [Nocardioides aromaticivorans]